MSKELSDWRKNAPHKKLLREDKIDYFREGVSKILQHGIHAHGWEELWKEICDRAEKDFEDAKNFIIEAEKSGKISKPMSDKLIYLLISCSKDIFL